MRTILPFKLMFIVGFLLFPFICIEAQNTSQVTGKVTNQDGEAIPFVNVIVKGTSVGTSADIDGNYAIQASPDQTLVFSYIGFERKEVTVGDQSVINIQLQEDVAALDEIVVVGYGTQERKDLTSAKFRSNSKKTNYYCGGEFTRSCRWSKC